jgi:threonine/homoserine/homoserine lactone efflux protein
MIDETILLHFLFACLVIELTPGPNMGYLALLSATHGRRVGFQTVVGIALGLALLGSVTALGLQWLITHVPSLFMVLRWAGVIYMLWLAFDAWQQAETAAPHRNLAGFAHVRRGFVTNLLNPKAALFYFTVLPEFLTHQQAQQLYPTLLLTTISIVIATAVHCMIVLAASQLHRWLSHPLRQRIAGRCAAILLALIAFWLAT